MIRLLKFFGWSIVAVFCGLLLALSGAFLYLSPGLPSVEALRSIQLQIPLRVYSSDGKLIAEFGEMRRTPIRFADIPPNFINALLSAEDDNFANHYGVDPSSLMRAATQLVKSGHIQSGGSTITMQVAKNFFLSSERSFSRKTTEILLALQIERQLTKDEILELYVNKIYLGNRAYGIEAAAQVYYGKSIRDVSLAQMAMIAGLPKAPSRFNPLANPARSKERRDWILGRMYKLGKISEADYTAAINEPLNASYHVPTPEVNAPYIAEMARAEMVGRYGSDAYTEGFRVTTTVPSDLQELANTAVHEGLITYDQRHGYRGPESRLPGKTHAAWAQELTKQRSISGLEPAIVTQVDKNGLQVLTRTGEEHVGWDSMKWARPFLNTNSMGAAPKQPSDVAQVGDLIRVQRQADNSLKFRQIPVVQGALVSLDPQNGAIRSLVGGFAFEQSNYNRALQAKRQPGSSFKPFVYSAALDNGYTAASLVNDAPIVFVDEYLDKVWRPKNDTNTFLGPIRMREALYKSRNLVSIRLLQSLGVDRTIDYISKFGFNKQDLPRNLSLALGTATLTPMEIATGWSVFANGGYKVTPYIIDKIESRNGETLFTANPPSVPAGDTASSGIAAPAQQGFTVDNVPGETPSQAPVQAPAVAERIIDGRTTYILNSMLEDVIKLGTGRRALALGRTDLAGKTGTTNESKDAWFSGYNADYVTTVWTGFDQPESLGRREYGGTVALPIWMNYMGAALKDKPAHTQAEPEGILSLRVDPVSGRAATPGTPNAYFELFKSEDTPPSVNELGNGYAPGSPLPADESAPIDLF
ncbi:penicillin-binding protein 1A [Pseudomonas sp. 09C 129]|uniref:Penicillin-binding protein 1A n=1 Tax=Pseudomonas chlororaphis TaxID=587753 RepID=A0AB34CBX3_9PSED|nr:penicillin-binding protein 1A [Pseudomonas sp. 09C 129]KAA5844980.1 penicillin-binding protein 1A [Pseudomonas chlororaphis]PMY43711.1 penicillin-binding protein 1A [Pseudomonas sp. GW456-L14]PMY58475.1 penicillin-binding protein 1A [Pseudomonas sp. GW456-L12]PMY69468.1 penicillin-binding protein 1A [Pseudomonas sp. FW305-25]PMY71266.1 penicillin-binding protein 1A [Pseudomonas sp. FW126-L8]PNA81038.1 penicillin-binding protein 1A [Pseudomonas sp. FW305-76]